MSMREVDEIIDANEQGTKDCQGQRARETRLSMSVSEVLDIVDVNERGR